MPRPPWPIVSNAKERLNHRAAIFRTLPEGEVHPTKVGRHRSVLKFPPSKATGPDREAHTPGVEAIVIGVNAVTHIHHSEFAEQLS